MGEVTRRTVVGGLVTVVGALFGGDSLSNPAQITAAAEEARKQTYKSPRELADILKQMDIRAEVHDHSGNRTLLVIGETHGKGTNKFAYPYFFAALHDSLQQNNGELSRLFMEFMYAGDTNSLLGRIVRGRSYQPSYFQRQVDLDLVKDIVEHQSRAPNIHVVADFHGYEELSSIVTLEGVDNQQLVCDATRMYLLAKLCYVLDNKFHPSFSSLARALTGSKESSVQDIYTAIDRLVASLETCSFQIKAADLQPDRVLETGEQAMKLSGEIGIQRRNQHFAQTINDRLRMYENNALIVGDRHMSNSRPFEDAVYNVLLPGFNYSGYGSLLDQFKALRINIVYVRDEQIRDFYKKR